MDLINISIVGVSRRVLKFYLPLLKNLLKQEKVTIGFVYNRDFTKAKKLVNEFGSGTPIQDFSLLKKNKKLSHQELIIVSLPAEISFEYNLKLINLGFNLFVETPLAQKLWQADILEKKAKDKSLFIGVGEDYCFSPTLLLIKEYCQKRKIPEMIRNTGKSNSYHSFAIFSSLYELKKLPDINYFKSFICRSKDLNIKTEIYKFNDKRTYILESYEPYNNVTRNLGELQLFFKDLTLTEKNYIFKGSKKINTTTFKEIKNNQLIYKSSLLENWQCNEFHQIESNFPLESSKTNGLYYNFLKFLEMIKINNIEGVPYGLKNAKFDLYLAKIQYLNKKIRISNIFVIKILIYFLKILKKI